MEVFDLFLSFLKNIKHFTASSVEAYANDLSIFANWLEDISLDVFNVTVNDIRIFVCELSEKNFSPASINRMLSSVRGFYKYARAKKLIEVNPAIGVKNLKISYKIKSFLFPDEMKSFCKLPYNSDILWVARDVALFTSLYSTGCRVSELVSLNMEDLSGDLKRAVVMGKGKKEREVFFANFAIDALKKYFPERTLLFKKTNKYVEKEDNPVFLNLRGGRLSIWGVNYIIKRYGILMPQMKKLSPHSFRHSFATTLITCGADIRIVQELLGHECISTTQIYTHITEKSLYELYKKAHPHS